MAQGNFNGMISVPSYFEICIVFYEVNCLLLSLFSSFRTWQYLGPGKCRALHGML